MKINDENNKANLKKDYIFLDSHYEIHSSNMEEFPLEEVSSYFTDYFSKFDYVLGDYAYHKLRLKGFYDSKSKKATKINDIAFYEEYLKLYCADGCAYFLLKKMQ